MHYKDYYFAAGRLDGRLLRSVRLSVYLCQFVSLSAHISQKPHVQISLNFLHMCHMSMVRSSSDGTAMQCMYESGFVDDAMFSHKKRIDQNQIQHVHFV